MECIWLSKTQIKMLNSMQGGTLKSALGFGKRSHHSHLLRALKVSPISDVILQDTFSLLNRVFKTASPYKSLCSYFLGKYILEGTIDMSSLVGRIIACGRSPLSVIFNNVKWAPVVEGEPNGIADSLQFLVNCDKFNVRDSREHRIATLLVNSF